MKWINLVCSIFDQQPCSRVLSVQILFPCQVFVLL